MMLTNGRTIEFVLEGAVASTEPDYTASWIDHDATAKTATPDAGDGTAASTTPVTWVDDPASGVQRQVAGLTLSNQDTQTVAVVVQLNNGSSTRRIGRWELLPLETLHYQQGLGFYVTDYTGSPQFDDRDGGVASLLGFAHVGGSGGVAANFVAGQVNGTALTTLALSANSLHAMPFVAPPRASVLNRAAVYVTTGVGSSTVRIGIYAATSETNLYPAALLWDSGALATATTNAIASGNPGLTLVPGRLYWAVVNSSSTPTVRGLAVGGACPIFGFPDAISGTAAQIGLAGTDAYGALPDPFPSSIAALTTAAPAVFLRFSA